MRNTDTTITELVQGAAVLGAIGAGAGLVYYGYHRLTAQLAADAAWWHYAVFDWRAAEHPLWKRVIAHLMVAVLLVVLLLFPFIAKWLWGE